MPAKPDGCGWAFSLIGGVTTGRRAPSHREVAEMITKGKTSGPCTDSTGSGKAIPYPCRVQTGRPRYRAE